MNHNNLLTSPNAIIDNVAHVLNDLKTVKLAFLFGSAATDRLRPDSDIDIALTTGKPLLFDERIQLCTTISTRLDREIDLIDLQEAHGLLLHEILIRGRQIICSDYALKTFLFKEMVYFAEDLLPQINVFLDTRAKRFAHG